MMCAATWLRRLQLPLPFRVAALLMLTATTALMHHAVSYRPDYWILALSALSAHLLLRPTRGWATVPLLAAIPAVAFYVKVTGVSILGSICVALWLQGSRRLAVGCFALGLFLLAGSIGVIDHLSEGGLRANLRSGGHMPFSLAFPLQLLAATPELILPLFAPLACLLLPHLKGPASRPMAVLYSFWGVSLLVGLSTSTRTGSNSYYFLEGFFYGTLILVYHLHHAAFLVRGVEGRAVGGWLLAVAWTGILVRSLVSPNHDYAARVTVRHGAHRAGLAAQINASKQACFCDDEGLNTLLERPAVIHPYVQTSLIAGGALPADTLSGPVYRREYALILLVGDTMTHQDVETLSDPFRDALTRYYVEAPSAGSYRTFVPRK
jgi:hypothetical protein